MQRNQKKRISNATVLLALILLIICVMTVIISATAGNLPETYSKDTYTSADTSRYDEDTVPTIEYVYVEIPVMEYVYIEVPVEKKSVYSFTSEEREMLARLVYLEAGIESKECQMAVCSVVINRLNNGYWGDTLEEVVYAKNQFSPANKISNTTPSEKEYESVDYVLQNGVTIPEYVMYFRAGHHFNWDGFVPYTAIDHTYFGYLEKDYQAWLNKNSNT